MFHVKQPNATIEDQSPTSIMANGKEEAPQSQKGPSSGEWQRIGEQQRFGEQQRICGQSGGSGRRCRGRCRQNRDASERDSIPATSGR
jgi:hypothetical protein